MTLDLTAIADPQTANAKGMAALNAGRSEDAAALFRRAIEFDPMALPLHRNLATACRQSGDDAGERAALEAALAIDRLDFGSWLRKAQLHQRLGEEAEAMAAWSAVLQMASGLQLPPEIETELAKGRDLLTASQQRLSAAVEAGLSRNLGTLGETGDRRAQAFLDLALGRRRSFTNQCSGLYYPFLPADEFFDAHHFAWFSVLREAAPRVREEFLGLLREDALPVRPYVQMDKGTPANDWTPLDGSLDWSAAFLWEYGVPNRELLARCPATAEMLDAVPRAEIPGRAPTAFFSILKAGSHIPPHTGVSNTRAIVHLPLVVPDGCGFRVGGETRSWHEGEPFAFDDTIEHEAWNRSAQDRAVLIFDAWNPHLSAAERDVIAAYYRIADETGLNPEKRDI